jgi:hypothetical protein
MTTSLNTPSPTPRPNPDDPRAASRACLWRYEPAVVVEVAAAAAGAPLRDVDLPRHERPDDRQLWPSAGSLRPPRWPWWLLAAATVVAADVACRLAGGPGLPFPWPGFGR